MVLDLPICVCLYNTPAYIGETSPTHKVQDHSYHHKHTRVVVVYNITGPTYWLCPTILEI